MSVTSDKKVDVLKWQAAIALVRANADWDAALNMWGLDSDIEVTARKKMRAANEKFVELSYK